MNKQTAAAMYQQAGGLHAQGRNEEALKLLDQLQEAFPDEKSILLAKARVLDALGRFQDAWKTCMHFEYLFPGPEAEELKANLAEKLVSSGAARKDRSEVFLGLSRTQLALAVAAVVLWVAGSAMILSGGRFMPVSGAWVLTAAVIYTGLVFAERIYDINDFLLESCSWAAWNTAPIAVVIGVGNVYPGLQGFVGQMAACGGSYWGNAGFLFLMAPLWALAGLAGSAVSVGIYRFIIDVSENPGMGGLVAILSGALFGSILFFLSAAEAQFIAPFFGFIAGFAGWWLYLAFGILNRRIAASLLR